MRRIIGIAVAAGVGLVGLAASPASAAPSNKNTEVIHATCDGGQAFTISVVHKKNDNADLVSAGPVVGGGSTTVASVTVYELGTTNVVFSADSHYGGPVNATCTGTLTEGGDTFDFVVQAHLAGV